MDFVQKSKFLVWVFCTEIMSEKMVFSYFGYKTNIVRTKNWSFNRGQKMDIFLKGLDNRFCPKIELFLIGVFYKNHIRKHRFWYCGKKRTILSRKKFKFSKGPKNGHFPKGLVHGFCPKIKISRMGVLYRNYVRKNGF